MKNNIGDLLPIFKADLDMFKEKGITLRSEPVIQYYKPEKVVTVIWLEPEVHGNEVAFTKQRRQIIKVD